MCAQGCEFRNCVEIQEYKNALQTQKIKGLYKVGSINPDPDMNVVVMSWNWISTLLFIGFSFHSICRRYKHLKIP